MIVILMVTSDFDSEADGESFSPLFTYLLLYSSPWKGLQGEIVDERHSFLWLFPAFEDCFLSQVTE